MSINRTGASCRATSLPRFEPMSLASLHVPFDHPKWIFELKYDGFRALAYIDGGRCSLISRNGNAYTAFPALCDGLGAAIRGRAVLDGEIVHLDSAGVPRFYDLMRRRQPQHFYAFDLLWLNGRDLRSLPLLRRKRMLQRIVRPPALYVSHVEQYGSPLFAAACSKDLEGIVAKLASGEYNPDATTWVKIKNRAYSQAEGRAKFFEGRLWPVKGAANMPLRREEEEVLKFIASEGWRLTQRLDKESRIYHWFLVRRGVIASVPGAGDALVDTLKERGFLDQIGRITESGRAALRGDSEGDEKSVS